MTATSTGAHFKGAQPNKAGRDDLVPASVTCLPEKKWPALTESFNQTVIRADIFLRFCDGSAVLNNQTQTGFCLLKRPVTRFCKNKIAESMQFGRIFQCIGIAEKRVK